MPFFRLPSLRRKSSTTSSLLSRSSSTSSMSSDAAKRRYASSINSIISTQPAMIDRHEEFEAFSNELTLLEPRPVVYWSSVEERMGSLNSL